MNCRDFPENFQDKERFSETGTWKPAGKRGLFFLSPRLAIYRLERKSIIIFAASGLKHL